MQNNLNQYIRSSLFLLGVFSLGFNGLNLLHELGHCLAFWIMGASVDHISIHPFGWSFAYSQHPMSHPIFGTAAGAVFSIALGVLLIACTHNRFSPWVVPLFMTGICCVIGNGSYYLTDLLVQGRGDATNLINHGIPWSMIAYLTLCTLIAGSVLSLSLSKAVGIRPSHTLLMRLGILYSGIGLYFVGMTVYNQLYKPNWLTFWLTYSLIFMTVITLSALLSLRLQPKHPQKTILPLPYPTWTATGLSAITGIITVLLLILFHTL